MNFMFLTCLAPVPFDILRAVTDDPSTATDRGKTFARIVKHLYLSNDGKILKIEFEPWGWYLMRLIDANVPNFLYKARERVHIMNTSNELDGKKLSDAAMYFAKEKGGEALGQNANAASEWIRAISDMMKPLLKRDTQAMQKAMIILLGMMANLPTASMLGMIAPVLEQKPKRINKNKI